MALQGSYNYLISLRLKKWFIPNRLYALINCQVRVQLYPLACIAHKREVKTPVPGILYPSKFRREAWLYWIWACHAIFGAKIERLVVPLAVNIDDVVELRLLSRVVTGYISASERSQCVHSPSW
ncbi:MAG TPA: hypothetical protein VF844_09430 [Ktedonobacteraceae bacterium]